MILKILLIVFVLIVAVLAFAATKPDVFQVQRSTSIHAEPEKIFALINDLHSWKDWAPQDKQDPTMKRTFSGSPNGVGAISDWVGSGSSGQGRMLITESVPPQKVSIQVDFTKPFEAHNVNQFVLEPDGTSTRVTWSMRGSNVYVMKLMSIFVNMDKVMGKHFEEGLSNLKAAAEK